MLSKVDIPDSNTTIIWTPIFHLYLSGLWLGVDVRISKRHHVLKRDWTTCSEYDNYLRFNSNIIGWTYMTT